MFFSILVARGECQRLRQLARRKCHLVAWARAARFITTQTRKTCLDKTKTKQTKEQKRDSD